MISDCARRKQAISDKAMDSNWRRIFKPAESTYDMLCKAVEETNKQVKKAGKK